MQPASWEGEVAALSAPPGLDSVPAFDKAGSRRTEVDFLADPRPPVDDLAAAARAVACLRMQYEP